MQSGFPNIRHMRVFVETARTGSVSTAAELCHLSQPAATQAISSLEANFGTPLLIRKRQGSTLTTCGTLVERRTRAALKHLRDGAKNALREAGNKAVRRQNFELSVTASQLRNLIAIANAGSFYSGSPLAGVIATNRSSYGSQLGGCRRHAIFHRAPLGRPFNGRSRCFHAGGQISTK